MAPTEDFPAYNRLADALIERATKDQLADVARLLALNTGWYQVRYGDVPQEALLKMVSLARELLASVQGLGALKATSCAFISSTIPDNAPACAGLPRGL